MTNTYADIEFAVQMTCDSCVRAVYKALADVASVRNVRINLSTGSVLVNTALPAQDVQRILETTGRKVAIRGLGGCTAGVAILDTGATNAKGVVRFMQQGEVCVIDGTVDGLKPGMYKLSVHESGDISRGCASVGDYLQVVDNDGENIAIYHNLGNVQAGPNGRAAFRLENSCILLPDMIGRALVLADIESTNGIICGVIARSAGLFENPKSICACDGVTIWNEKIEPGVLA